MAMNAVIEVSQIADHAVFVDLPAERDFQNVVMPVAVRVVALAISRTVLCIGHLAAVETVRCGEAVAAIQICLHADSLLGLIRVLE